MLYLRFAHGKTLLSRHVPGCCCTLWSPWLSPALLGRGAPRLVKTTTSSFCVPGGMLTAWGPWTVCVATMPPAWAQWKLGTA